jgi:hypothetical protein
LRDGALVVVAGALAVALAVAFWWLPARQSAAAAAEQLASARQAATEAQETLSSLSSVESVAALLQQVRAADTLVPSYPEAEGPDVVPLAAARAVAQAATLVGGQVVGTPETFAVEVASAPPSLRGTGVSFVVVVPPARFSEFVAAVNASGLLFSVSAASVTPPDGGAAVSVDAPQEVAVTGVAWWSTRPAAQLPPSPG